MTWDVNGNQLMQMEEGWRGNSLWLPHRNSYTELSTFAILWSVNHVTILPIQRVKIATKNLYIPKRRLRRICMIQTYRQSSKWSAVSTFWVTKCSGACTQQTLCSTYHSQQNHCKRSLEKKKLLWWEIQSLTSTGKYSKLVYTRKAHYQKH